MAYQDMSMRMLTTLLGQMAEQASGELQANRFAQAEEAWEEAVSMSRYMASVEPGTALLAHGDCLYGLGITLLSMGADPEAEDPLLEAVEVYRKVALNNPGEAEPALAEALVSLAKVYRGARYYVDFGQPLMTDRHSMREYRRNKIASGTWGGARVQLVDPEWAGDAEGPLLEAIPLTRRLARAQREQFESMLALALNLLGETYVNTGRTAAAVSPLREAEALYRGLVRDDPSRFQPMLTDTLDLLGQATQENAAPRDRISVLEEILPELRLEGSITDWERENGVPMAKALARDRLRDTLKELVSLYADAGREKEARDLRDGELGILMTESLRIRPGRPEGRTAGGR